MLDLYNNTVLKKVLSNVSVSDNTAQNGDIIDTQGFGGVLFGILPGTLADADATFAVTAKEGNQANLSDATDVDPSNLIGTLAGASFQFDDDNEVRKILVRPSKRYTRIIITPSGNASAAGMSAFALLLEPTYAPVTQPQS